MEDERIELKKEWGHYCTARHMKEIQQIDRVIISQKAALEQLRLLDQDLYKHAVSIDSTFVPFKAKGPYHSLPIQDYIQDGEYENITKSYEVQYEDTKAFITGLLKKQGGRKKKKVEEEES